LDTLAGIMGEMARIYREARRQQLPADIACKLVYILKEMRGCLETQELVELQRQLEELTRHAASARGKPFVIEGSVPPPLSH
jgi:hypothetical protein